MTSITAKFVKDGNSTAIRLPKTILTMSGLYGLVQLEAKKGQITIKQNKKHFRDGWQEQIDKVLAEESHIKDDYFSDMDKTVADGLDEFPWEGISYQEWMKKNAKK